MGIPKDELTGHGFRHMASTLLHEQGWDTDWIEVQLAHGRSLYARKVQLCEVPAGAYSHDAVLG